MKKNNLKMIIVLSCSVFSFSSAFAITCDQLKKAVNSNSVVCSEMVRLDKLRDRLFDRTTRSVSRNYDLRVNQLKKSLETQRGEDYSETAVGDLETLGEGPLFYSCQFGKHTFDRVNIGQGGTPLDYFFETNSTKLANITREDGNTMIDGKACDVMLDI